MASLSHAETHLFYFGGGGEKTDSQNQFDETLRIYAELAQKKSWRSEFQTDVSHPSTKRELENLAPLLKGSSVQNFTASSLRRRLQKLRQEIKNGRYKSGDQIMLVVDTHGSLLNKRAEFYGVPIEKNEVALSTTTDLVDILPELREIAREIKDKDLRLGVHLKNCYSGNLMSAMNLSKEEKENLCVITESAQDRVAFSENEISRSISQAFNLEEAFLKGRRNLKNSPFQPMISTPAGLRTSANLDFIKNHMYSEKDDAARATRDRQCTNTDQHLENLTKVARDVELSAKTGAISQLMESSSYDINAIRALIESQKASEQKAGEIRELSTYGLSFQECLHKPLAPQTRMRFGNDFEGFICDIIHQNGKRSQAYYKGKIDELMNQAAVPQSTPQEDPDGFYKEHAGKLPSDPNKVQALKIEFYQKKLRNLDRLLNDPWIQKEISHTQGLIQELKNHYRDYPKASSRDFIDKERRLYNQLYKHYSEKNQLKRNACRDFQL